MLWCSLASPLSSAGAPGAPNDDCFLHACMSLIQIFSQRCPASLLHYTSHMPVPSAHHCTLASLSSSLHHRKLPQQMKWKLFCVEQTPRLKMLISLIRSGFDLVSFFSSGTKHDRSDTARGVGGVMTHSSAIPSRALKTHVQDPDHAIS